MDIKNITVASVKKYIAENAPALVTAAATVSIAVLLQKHLSVVSGHFDAQEETRLKNAGLIEWFKKEGNDFDYYPGIGIFSDPSKWNSKES